MEYFISKVTLWEGINLFVALFFLFIFLYIYKTSIMRVSILRLCLIGVKIKMMENKKEKIREIWMRGVFG